MARQEWIGSSSDSSCSTPNEELFSPGAEGLLNHATPYSQLSDDDDVRLLKLGCRMRVKFRQLRWDFDISSTEKDLLSPCLKGFQEWLARFDEIYFRTSVVEISSALMLAASLLDYLVRLEVKQSLLCSIAEIFERDFLSTLDIHSLAIDLNTPSRIFLLRAYYSGLQAAGLSPKPAPSELMRQAEKGDVRVYGVFGGQGTGNLECLQQLCDLFSTYVGLLDGLIGVFARTLENLARLPRTRYFYEIHGFDILKWLAQPSSFPDQKYIASAPISFPLVGLLGLSHYFIACKILGKHPGEMRKLLGGVTGHSQGIIVAAAISESDSWESMNTAAELVAETLFWAGFESHHGTSWGDCTLASVDENSTFSAEQSSSRMLSVRGLPQLTLQSILDRANKHHPATDRMYLSLINAHENMVVAGPPKCLKGLTILLQEIGAESGLDQSRVPFDQRKPSISFQFLPISAPFHTPHLNNALAKTIEAIPDRTAGRLGIALYHTKTGEDLRNSKVQNLTEELVRMVMTECVNWRKTCNFPGVTHILDFGPGRVSNLLKEKTDGSGVRVILASEFYGSKHVGGMTELFSRKLHPAIPNWGEIYRPKFCTTLGGEVEIVTKMTKLFGTPPVMVAGMTPTTVHWDFASAVMKAGYHVELAGGGYSDPAQFEGAIRALADSIPVGRGITCNLIYVSPQAIAWQIPLIGDLIKKGVHIDGLTIGAGVPSLAVMENYAAMGLKHISFKPGTYEAILDVIDIAKAHPGLPIGLQWTGGRGGGHHSAEDFHAPVVRAYGLIRECSNIVLVAGSGFGSLDAEDSYPYLTGEWSSILGYPRMPFDGILLGSRMMIAKEAHTSQAAKQLIVDTPGVDNSKWPGTYKAETGGVLTVNSEMGQPIHKLATRGVILWHELDGKIFSIKQSAKRLDELQKNRDWIIERINKDFQKPWFGVKDSGHNVDIDGMTYAEVLRRLVDLMYVEDQQRWIHSSYKSLVVDVSTRFQERLPAMHEFSKDLIIQPRKFLLHFSHSFPSAETQLVQREDARHILSLFKRRGQKPVNFVPALDENFEQWFKKDSLWQAEDLDAVVDRDVQRICIIHGPVAACHSKKINESVQKILDDIVASLTKMLTRDSDPVVTSPNINPLNYRERTPSLDGNYAAMEDKVHVFPNDSPSLKEDLPLLEFMREMPGWAQACFEDIWISRGGTRQPNPVRSLFIPRHGHLLTSKYSSRKAVTSITLSKLDPYARITKDLARIASAGADRVIVTLHADLASNTTGTAIEFIFEYMPENHDGRLREEMGGRNMKIKNFYGDLWADGNSQPASNNGVYNGSPVMLSKSLVAEFLRVLGASESPNKGVPLDIGIIVAWETLVRPLLAPAIDGDLLQLLHQSNEFEYLPDIKTFQVGDILTSASRVNSIIAQTDRKTVEVIAIIRREEKPVMKVTSVFVFKGDFSAYADSFRCFADDFSLLINSKNTEAVLRSRHWMQLKDKKLDIMGRTLVFKVESRLDYNGTASSFRLQIIGGVYLQSQNKDLEKIGNLRFHSPTCSGNPITEFLKRHGATTQQSHPLNNPQPACSTTTTVTMPLSNAPYARISKDTNPIHTSHVFASWLQLPGPITHGMHTSAAVRRAIENIVANGDTKRFRRYSSSFQAMVLPGDELKLDWQHVAMINGRMQVKIQAYNCSTNDKVLDAEAEIEQVSSAYIFTGQGSQEKAMGMELYHKSAAARDVWDRGDTYLRDQYGFSIIDLVQKDPKSLVVHFGGLRGEKVKANFLSMSTSVDQSKGKKVTKCVIDVDSKSTLYTFYDARGLLYSTQFAQPALVLMQMAIFADLKSRGLIQENASFAGHSLGEYAALGALTDFMPLESLLDLVFYRGLAMQASMERDEQGRTGFSMVAVNPSRIGTGFRFETFEEIVRIVSKETSLLLEIVNHNIEGQQYVCAGHLHALQLMSTIFNRISQTPELTLPEIVKLVQDYLPTIKAHPQIATLERGVATIPLSGIDIPFHSKFLRGGIDSYRQFLRKKISVDDIDPAKLVGLWIPNLIGQPFDTSKTYIKTVMKMTGSKELEDLLEQEL